MWVSILSSSLVVGKPAGGLLLLLHSSPSYGQLV